MIMKGYYKHLILLISLIKISYILLVDYLCPNLEYSKGMIFKIQSSLLVNLLFVNFYLDLAM